MKIKTDCMLSKLGRINDEEFKVLFFILNTINMNSGKERSVKIYRAVLADLTGKSERTISRITNKLVEQGLIVKDNVSNGDKLFNYYSIPVAKNEEKLDNEKQKTESNLVTDDRVKEHKRTLKKIKEYKEIKENKEMEEKRLFKQLCEPTIVDDFEYTSMDEELLDEYENIEKSVSIPTVEISEVQTKNKFQKLEDFIEECLKDKKTYQETVSQIGAIFKWIKDNYSEPSNRESLINHANCIISDKLAVFKAVS